MLHTEFQRLREMEQKGVDGLIKRKADIKAYSLANGGKVPKDDGMGVIIRKELTATRTKLRIVKKKIKKYGALGKIPMGASMRVYNEDSDSDASSSTTELEEDLSGSSSDSDARKRKENRMKLKMKKTNEVLSSGLVYQPTFNKVVNESSRSLPKYDFEMK